MDVKSRRQLKGLDMNLRLKHELQGKEPQTIKELNLDSCRDIQIENLGEDYKCLETLSLINVGLTTLRGFPKLPNLKRIELSDNKLTGSLEYLITCPNLTHLNLSGNKIKDIEELEPLAKLIVGGKGGLTHLDLFNCEVTTVEGYRAKLFTLIPSLKFLDGFDQAGDNEEDLLDEDEEDDEEDEEDIDDSEEDDGEEEGEGEEDEDEENGPGLSYLAKSNLKDDDEEDDGDFKGDEEMKE